MTSWQKSSESEVQAAICDYLAAKRIFFVRLNNIPGFFIGKDGRKQFRSLGKYARKGMSDILAIKNGRAIFIEVKREDVNPQRSSLISARMPSSPAPTSSLRAASTMFSGTGSSAPCVSASGRPSFLLSPAKHETGFSRPCDRLCATTHGWSSCRAPNRSSCRRPIPY